MRRGDCNYYSILQRKLSKSFVASCIAHKWRSQDSISAFVSPPHGLWENIKFLMNCLNGFPEGKRHKSVWAVSGRAQTGRGVRTAGQGQAEG